MSNNAKSRIWIAIGLSLIGFALLFIMSLTGCKGPETVAEKTSRTGYTRLHYYKTR